MTGTALLLVASLAVAPSAGHVRAASASAAPAPQAADTSRTPEWRIATAVLAVPAELRDAAEVRAWAADGTLRTLRQGTNGIICLADRPGDGRFAAACYHASLEPFMARGRELTAQGVEGRERDEIRWREVEAGTLPMPERAMVFNLGFATEDIDPETIDPATGGRLYSLYMPGATTETTGLPSKPSAEPWLMHAGTPSAHVMIGIPPKQQ